MNGTTGGGEHDLVQRQTQRGGDGSVEIFRFDRIFLDRDAFGVSFTADLTTHDATAGRKAGEG
ncbi:MAG: hypothetical protein R3F31_00980 [Verrucomicrobiales bacterium]